MHDIPFIRIKTNLQNHIFNWRFSIEPYKNIETLRFELSMISAYPTHDAHFFYWIWSIQQQYHINRDWSIHCSLPRICPSKFLRFQICLSSFELKGTIQTKLETLSTANLSETLRNLKDLRNKRETYPGRYLA